jgi:uncharacterized small protein (DUF1192 family)
MSKHVCDKDRFPAPGERSDEDAEAPVFAGGGKPVLWSVVEITLEMRVARLEREISRLKAIVEPMQDRNPPDLSLKREPELSNAQEETLVSLLTALHEYVYGLQYPPVETVVRDLMEDLKARMPDLYKAYLSELGARLLAREQAGLDATPQ